MKTTIIFLALSVLNSTCQTAATFLYRFPHPIIQNRQVDITPVFHWWAVSQTIALTNGTQPPSPMPAYVHIAGPILKEEPAGWVIDAKIETAPGKVKEEKIFVLNPPVNEKQRFETLKAEYNKQMDTADSFRLISSYNRNDSQEFRNRSAVLSQAGAGIAAQNNTDAAKRADQNTANANVKAGESAARAEEIQSELRKFPFAIYEANFFSFQTGTRYEGLPAFDAGLRFEK